MKTRIKLHLIIYIAFAGLFMACENEIPYNPGQQNPQLIMNALLNAGQTENLVYLHLSEGNSIGRKGNHLRLIPNVPFPYKLYRID